MAKDLTALRQPGGGRQSSRTLCGARVSVRDFLCSGASPNPLRKPRLTLSSSSLRRMVFICVRDLSVFSHSPGCSLALPQEGGLKTEECKGRQAPPDVEEEVWRRCQPAQSKLSRSSEPVVSTSPSSLAGPTPSASSGHAHWNAAHGGCLLLVGCILKSQTGKGSLLETPH